MRKIYFIGGAVKRKVRQSLPLFLLAVCCCVMAVGCASTRRTSTVNSIQFDAPPIEVLPIAADVAVTGRKGSGEASGKSTERERLRREALAKALNQDPPSADGADLLVGADVFEERRGTEVKVTVTGYHAYYTSFRTAPPDTISQDQRDSLRREEYADIFEIARTLKDLADEDSAQVEVVKNGRQRAVVRISYEAKHLQPKTETINNSDGSTSKVVQPVYHNVIADGVFDVNMSNKKVRRSSGKTTITDQGKGNDDPKKGFGVVLGICGGLLLLIILSSL